MAELKGSENGEPKEIQAVASAKANTTSEILSKKAIQELTERLQSERTRIHKLYTQDLKAGLASRQEGTDDIVDQANSAYNRELMFSLSNTERELIFEIDEALERMEKGTYGFCVQSGEPIPIQRLEAIPWARYSIQIQEKVEQGLIEPVRS